MRQFAAMGFAGYLPKPVRTSELFACIDRVLARETNALVTRNVLQERATQRKFAGRVLLIEDNAVNQKVAGQFLTRLGCEVEIADNGEQGVKAFEAGDFALVLMDLQMPVMDGYAATRRIRDHEGWRKRTPIVALTANAMAGQMERCMAAGMDGFLTKPLDALKLREILTRYGLAADSKLEPKEVDRLLGTDAELPVDLPRLREMADDEAFLRELADTFVQSAREIRTEMMEMAARRDGDALSKAAHKLKGAAANMHARPLSKLAEVLEVSARELPSAAIDEHLKSIDRAIEQTIRYLLEGTRTVSVAQSATR
jgi:two-component system sensor histidine kinase/response regulator